MTVFLIISFKYQQLYIYIYTYPRCIHIYVQFTLSIQKTRKTSKSQKSAIV